MPAPHPRPDFDAHARALRLPTADVVAELREVLGARLVAYIAGTQDTMTVRRWVEGTEAPGADVERRLRSAFQAALTIASAEDAAIAQAWFQGRAPELDDVSPARWLRDGEPRAAAAVVSAARTYLAGA